tara:strand:+ start:644 stop:790 length:147 start_codon:yes stop_codon:yes gene_type:complete
MINKIVNWLFTEEEQENIGFIYIYFMIIAMCGGMMWFVMGYLRFKGGF